MSKRRGRQKIIEPEKKLDNLESNILVSSFSEIKEIINFEINKKSEKEEEIKQEKQIVRSVKKVNGYTRVFYNDGSFEDKK